LNQSANVLSREREEGEGERGEERGRIARVKDEFLRRGEIGNLRGLEVGSVFVDEGDDTRRFDGAARLGREVLREAIEEKPIKEGVFSQNVKENSPIEHRAA
jgi:hypothetical protein